MQKANIIKTKVSGSENDFYMPFEHYNLDAEKAVLGACLLEADSFSRVMGLCEWEHFYHPLHQQIYACLGNMYGDSHIDLITVAAAMRKAGTTEYDGQNIPWHLCQITMDVVTSAHVESHALIIRELYVERLLKETQMGAAKGDGDSIDRANRTQELITKALQVNATDDWKDMSQVIMSLMAHRDRVKGKDLMGVPTGLPTLDSMTAGLQGTQLIVLGARPSVGKTAFIGGLVIHAAKMNKRVGVISLEMPEEQIGARLSAVYSDLEFWRIYRNIHSDADEERRLMESLSNMAGIPVHISDKTNVTGQAIRAKAEKLKRRFGSIDMIVIDYMQLIETESGRNDTREREVAKLSRALKLMAMDMNIPVIVLCQLNRESDKPGHSKKPRMSQLRESGSIEQDADIVMLLHREWKSGNITDEQGNSTERQAELIVEKNRNGETGSIKLDFNPETMRFSEPVFGSFDVAPSLDAVRLPYPDDNQPIIYPDDAAPF